MLDSVIGEVTKALRGAGIEAVEAYPKRDARRCGEALVCVGVKSARALPAGFGAYLGLGVDPETGRTEELYGARYEIELALDVYAQRGGAECTKCAGEVPAALASLPEGIKISALSFGQAAPDERTGMFRCPGALSCTAFFVAREKDEDGVFSDFILRGSVKR